MCISTDVGFDAEKGCQLLVLRSDKIEDRVASRVSHESVQLSRGIGYTDQLTFRPTSVGDELVPNSFVVIAHQCDPKP